MSLRRFHDHPCRDASHHFMDVARGLSALDLGTPAGAGTDLRRSMLGEDHPDTLESASNLALNLWALGQYKQAHQLAEETFTRSRRVLGADHSDTLRSATILTTVLVMVGQYDLARQLGKDTLTRYRKVLGEDHPYTLLSATILATVRANLSEHDQAPRLDK